MDQISRVKEEFTRQAETLSAAPVFTDSNILEKIVAAVGPAKGMRLLDLGCGPGIVTAALAPRAGEIMAYDVTPEMLEKARERCEKAGLKNVSFEQGRAEQLPFEDESFDGVVTRLTIHHFPDPGRVMGEVVRITRKKGKVVVADSVSAENDEEAELHNALEILRDPSHVRMLSPYALRKVITSSGLRIVSEQTWQTKRSYEEWIRITNAPERVKPLYTVMLALAQAGIRAGIGLQYDGKGLVFYHNYLLITAEKA